MIDCCGQRTRPNSYTVSLLEEVAELIQGYVDVIDGSDGPRPNQAMIAANKLNEAIEFLKATSPSAITATGDSPIPRNSEESERSLFMRWWSTFKSTVGDEEAASYAAWCAWLERGRLTQSESGLRPEDQFSMGDPHPCDMTAEERERAFAPSHERDSLRAVMDHLGRLTTKDEAWAYLTSDEFSKALQEHYIHSASGDTVAVPRGLAERTEAMFRSVDPQGGIAQEWAKVLRSDRGV